MLRRQSLRPQPPMCQCGRRTQLHRQGRGPFTRAGRREAGFWTRFTCPNYRRGISHNHFHGVIDGQGRPVELSRRHFKINLPGRPQCTECSELLATHAFNPLRNGGGRYFTCTTRGCSRRGEYLFHQEQEGGRWLPVYSAPGPKPQNLGTDECPGCGERGKLRSRGYFNKTRKYRKPYRRVECQACRQTFRLIQPGVLESAPAPGFQAKHKPPFCSVHGTAMRRGASLKRQDVGRFYQWRCRRARCKDSVLLDSNGSPVAPTPKRTPAINLRLRCEMLGCNHPRDNQIDGRKRYCREHSRLSAFQRWREQKKRRIAIGDEIHTRFRSAKVLIGTASGQTAGAPTELGSWLSVELQKRGESYRTAARKADLNARKIYNWVAGISVPRRDDPDFARLIDRLRIDPGGIWGKLVGA